MTTILLIRHGETEWNHEHRWQGHTDVPLNDTGRAQAVALGSVLAADPPDSIWSSDLSRARETAEIVGAATGVAVNLDPSLREVDVGEWAGLTTAEIEERYPEGLARRRRGGTGWEQGESMEAMTARFVAALRTIAWSQPGGRIAVVTHGGAIARTWIASGMAQTEWRPARNCGIYEVRIGGDGTLRWIAP